MNTQVKNWSHWTILCGLMLFLSCNLSRCAGPATETPTPPSETVSTQEVIATVIPTHQIVKKGPNQNTLNQVAGAGPFFQDEHLSLSQGGIADLEFLIGLKLTVFNESNIGKIHYEVDQSKTSPIIQLTFFLLNGGLSGNLDPTAGEAVFNVSSNVKISVYGTKFYIVYNPDLQVVSAGNFGGSVEIERSGERQALPQNQQVDIELDMEPSKLLQPMPLEFSLEEFNRQADIDRTAFNGLVTLREKYDQPAPGEGTPTETPTKTPTKTPTLEPPTITVTPPPQPDRPRGKIVFTCFLDSNDEICLMNADGSGLTRLTNEPATDWYASLAPDGSSIVFSSRRDNRFEIYTMNLDGSDQRQLTEKIGNLYSPAISPDGEHILFTNEIGGKQSIWVMNRDGSEPHLLIEAGQNAIEPVWSPEGQQIAFSSDLSGTTQIYLANTDGSNVHQVANTPKVGGRISWSPDGRTLAFDAGKKGEREIYLIGVDGTNMRKITEGGDNLAPYFSPDAQWITFTSIRSGTNQIYIMRSDGSEVTQLTFNKPSNYQPRWGP